MPAYPSYAGHRFPAEIISHAVWLYFRFPLSLRHVDEVLSAFAPDVTMRCGQRSRPMRPAGL
jgi:putative transposase